MSEESAKKSMQCMVYVIDPEFQLVHLNEEAKHAFPDAHLGKPCYTQLRGQESVCEDCPWAFCDFEVEGSTRKVIYNANLRQWLEISCIGIDWPGVGFCTAVAAKGIDETNKDSFARFTQQTVYDELVEVNLNNNTFRFLYVEQEKYELPLFSNSLDNIVDIAQYLIHPEDRKSFVKFWSPASIKSAFEEGSTEVRGEFRQKLKSGEYHWTSQTFACVEKNGKSDGNVFMCFILDIEDQKKRSAHELELQKKRIKALHERDPLTGLYRTESFFARTEELLEENPQMQFEIACMDMKNFRLFNEWYGRDAGDQLLKVLARRLKDIKRQVPAIAGYFGADNFAIVLPRNSGLEESLGDRIKMPSLNFEDNIGFFPVVGLCKVGEEGVALRTAFDRATIAKNMGKRNYVKRIVWYEEDATRQIEEEVRLLLEIQTALKNKEFTLYWQPQCDIRSGHIVGAEALVRWNHPQRGLVYPGEFIPLLEKTGFIVNLDLYVWEEVCRQIRAWIDEGVNPIPISVNISQADMGSLDVPTAIEELLREYRIDRSLLKLEITESMFAEDDSVSSMAARFKDEGLTVLMDDFGTGYSSLNILKNLDVDILKIDMEFLDWTHEKSGRGESILESVLHMTNLMELRVIAEGAETKDQIEFLSSIGCNYAQGYYFYRPMPTEKFDNLLKGQGKIDYSGVQQDPVKILDLEDLMSGNIANKTVLDNILGGIAIYEVDDDGCRLVEMNRQYRRITGDSVDEARVSSKDVFLSVHPEDVDMVASLFKRAERHPISGAQEIIRRCRMDGTCVWIWMRMFYLGAQDGKKLFYGALHDVTEERLRIEELEASRRALKVSEDTLDNILGVFDLDKDIDQISGLKQEHGMRFFVQNAPTGFAGFYYRDGWPLFYVNDNLASLLGYESFEEMSKAVNGLFANAVHPDDLKIVREATGGDLIEGNSYLTQYRLLRKDGSSVWVADRGRLFRSRDGYMASAASILDISESVEMQERLEVMGGMLRSIVQLANLDAWAYEIESDRFEFYNISPSGVIAHFLASNEHSDAEGGLVFENFSKTVEGARRLSVTQKADLHEFVERVRAGESFESSVVLVMPDESERTLAVKCKVVHVDGRPLRAIGYVRDRAAYSADESTPKRRIHFDAL